MQTLYTYSYNPSIAVGTRTTGTNWRMAYQQPIKLYKGAPNTIRLVVYNNAQKVVDLSNYDVQISIIDLETKERYVTINGQINEPTSGIVTFVFTNEDLSNLDNRFYHIVAKLTDPEDGSSIANSEILYIDDNYGAYTPLQIEDIYF